MKTTESVGYNTKQIFSEMNLEPIVVKAMDHDEGYGWTLPFALSVADEYRKFLALCVDGPDQCAFPSNYVDDFWHLHILDTQKYEEDCRKYIGYFLHHFPYFGMRGEDDAANLTAAWHETRSRYVARFGEIPDHIWPLSSRCPNCGRRCNAMTGRQEMRPGLAGFLT